MNNLYRLKTLLVLFFLSMLPAWTYAQFADPIIVNIRNSGATYTDQFSASIDYTFYPLLPQPNQSIGIANFVEGGSANTLIVTFTPTLGAVGTTDLIVTYYTLSAPMHPVTRWYRFNVSNEVVVTGNDKYLVDVDAVEVPLEVLANDSITNGQLFLKTVSVSNAGNASINAEGNAILFSPNADFVGDTWIQYIACDSFGNCGQGNTHILVRDTAVQDVIEYSKYLLNTEELEILTPFEDFNVDIEPQHGTLSVSGAFGWIYAPDPDFIGKDTFQVSLLDVTRKYLMSVYHKPTNVHARNDKFYVRPGLSVTFGVLNNDLLDYDVSSHTNPTKGVLYEVSNGQYTYTPNIDFKGVDKFTYTTCFQDTVYCETATVLIHVTNLEPDNQFSYELQTSKDVPLTFDYPIEYTDFAYTISDEPEHGTLVFHEGMQQINLPCDTIESFNMIIYEPAPGYTGPDHFEYYYFIQPSNLGYLVKVDMNVIEPPATENCPCTVGCVWPGDTDQNGRVDMSDLLTLGNSLGDAGPAREYAEPEVWFGQHANGWTTVDDKIKHIDADGDGTITALDVDQISNYYYQTHDVVVKDVQQKLPYQFSIIPIQYSLDSGDVVMLDIALGNANYPVIDLKGAKFSLNIPDFMMDSASVQVLFHQDSWLAEGASHISLGKVPWDGRVDAGFARANGNGASGFGVIATVVFIIEDDLEGFKTNNGIVHIPVTIQGGSAMGDDGTIYDLDGDEYILTYDLHSANRKEYNLLVYPNPATDIVDVHINGKTALQSINIIDPQGRLIKSVENIGEKHYQLDVNSLPVGLYYLHVNHTSGMISQLLSVIR